MFPLSALPSLFPIGLRCASRRGESDDGEGFSVSLCTAQGYPHPEQQRLCSPGQELCEVQGRK